MTMFTFHTFSIRHRDSKKSLCPIADAFLRLLGVSIGLREDNRKANSIIWSSRSIFCASPRGIHWLVLRALPWHLSTTSLTTQNALLFSLGQKANPIVRSARSLFCASPRGIHWLVLGALPWHLNTTSLTTWNDLLFCYVPPWSPSHDR